MRLASTISLAAAVLFAASAGQANASAGEKLFTDNNCNGCHYTQGPAQEKTIDDQLAKKVQNSGTPAASSKRNG